MNEDLGAKSVSRHTRVVGMTEHLVLSPSTEADLTNKHLLLMLHGFGSHERDLLPLYEYLPSEMVYASMRAPQPVGASLALESLSAYIPGAAQGFQWYPLDNALNTDVRAVELAADYIIEWLEKAASAAASITLLGFSQGAAMATTVARRRPDLVKAVVNLSGFVVEQESDYFKDDEFKAAQIPVFYGRDTRDPVIPADKVSFTCHWLRDNADVQEELYDGIFHGINLEEMADVKAFLQARVLG